jgi:hypothetical protein
MTKTERILAAAIASALLVTVASRCHAQQPPDLEQSARVQAKTGWTPYPTFKPAPYAVQRQQPGDYEPSVLDRELERAQEQAIRDATAILRSMARRKAWELTR